MKDSELFKYSKKIKEEADLILQRTRLTKILQEYGKVIFTGSYKYDLMLVKDIDVHVISKDANRTNAIKFHNELINSNRFVTCQFSDYFHWRQPLFPRGYYVGVKWKKRDCSNKWAIDIWYCKQYEKKNIDIDNLIENKLDNKNILTILKLKQYCIDNNLKIISPEIYDLVINKKVKNLEKFKRIIHERN